MGNLTKNILILIPGEHARGGITNYYASIRKHFPSNIIYFIRGSRHWPKKPNLLIEISRLLYDYCRFIHIVLFKDISLIQTSTAFCPDSVLRDGLFIILAKLLNRRVIVFYRGWCYLFVNNLLGYRLKLFKSIFYMADGFIELSENNMNHFRQLGYKKKIFLETTIVDIDFVKDINIENTVDKRFNKKEKTILFLSRIETTKGIYKVLDIFKNLKLLEPDFKLVFAGDGTELGKLKDEILKKKIKDVTITGFVQGEAKRDLFIDATMFLFLSESEGMPNALLEAMSFGLPIITTNVGGISSVFKNNRNGELLNEYDITYIIDKIRLISFNKAIYYSMSYANYNDSKQKFWSDIVSKRMIEIFKEISG